jgi:hypothetical protein
MPNHQRSAAALSAGIPFAPPAFLQMLLILHSLTSDDANAALMHDILAKFVPLVCMPRRDTSAPESPVCLDSIGLDMDWTGTERN